VSFLSQDELEERSFWKLIGTPSIGSPESLDEPIFEEGEGKEFWKKS